MNFKNKTVESRFKDLHPTLQALCKYMDSYVRENELDFTLTETCTTPDEDKALNRVSDSHSTRRAVDIRTKDWPEWFREKFIKHFTEKFGEIGAVNAEGESRLLVYHDSGFGPHIHCQLERSRYSLPVVANFEEEE